MIEILRKLFNRNKNNLIIDIKYSKNKYGWYFISNSLGTAFQMKLEPLLSKVLFNVNSFNFCVDYNPEEDFETVFAKLKNDIVFFHIGKEQTDSIASDRLIHYESYFITSVQRSAFSSIVDNAEYFNLIPRSRKMKHGVIRYSFRSKIPDIIPVGRLKSVYYVAYSYCFQLSDFEEYLNSTFTYGLDLFSNESMSYSVSSKFDYIARSMVDTVYMKNFYVLKLHDSYCSFSVNDDSIVITGYSNLAGLKLSFDEKIISKVKQNTEELFISHFGNDKNIRYTQNREASDSFSSYQFKFIINSNGYKFIANKLHDPMTYIEQKLFEDFEHLHKNLDKHICLRTSHRLLEKLIEKEIIQDKYSVVTQSDLDLYRMIEI